MGNVIIISQFHIHIYMEKKISKRRLDIFFVSGLDYVLLEALPLCSNGQLQRRGRKKYYFIFQRQNGESLLRTTYLNP